MCFGHLFIFFLPFAYGSGGQRYERKNAEVYHQTRHFCDFYDLGRYHGEYK